MKYLILGVVTLLAGTSVSAQRISAFRQQLNVREVGSAKAVVAIYDAQAFATTVDGYRVRIFFDNKQTARQASMEVRSQFDALYPDIPSYWSFDTPNFVVTVGNFVNKEDALALVGRIAGAFPKAFVIRQNLSISLFLLQK